MTLTTEDIKTHGGRRIDSGTDTDTDSEQTDATTDGALPIDAPESERTGEFRCPECGRRCTRGPSGTEYGHERGYGAKNSDKRCSRRTAAVDSDKPGGRGKAAEDTSAPAGSTPGTRQYARDEDGGFA